MSSNLPKTARRQRWSTSIIFLKVILPNKNMTAQRILRDSFRYVYLSNSSLFLFLQGWECSSVGEHLPNRTGHNSVLTSKTRKSKTPAQHRNQKGGLTHLMQASIHSGTALTSIKGSAKTGCYVCQRQSPPTQQRSCVHVTNENKKSK